MPRVWTEEERRRADEDEERHYWESVEEERREAEERETARLAAIERMQDWFFEQFEDPQVETPRDGEEQVFIYAWGGPFEASDVLHSNFGDAFSESWINQAVERIEREGTVEWAPTASGEFYEHPDEEEEPTETREKLTATALERLVALEEVVAVLRSSHGRLGHNQPPDAIGLPPYGDEEVAQATQAIADARAALAVAEPDPAALEGAAGRLDGLGGRIAAYVGQKADLAVDELIKSSIKAFTWTTAAAAFLAAAEILHRLAAVLPPLH